MSLDYKMPLGYWFDVEILNSMDYVQVRDYLKERSINNSFPMLVDRTTENSIIAKINDLGVVIEVEFDDKNLKWHILNVYRLVDKETKYGNFVDIEPVLDEKTMMKIIKLVDDKARGF